MNGKRIIALVLCMILTMGLCSGCNTGPKTNDPVNRDTTTNGKATDEKMPEKIILKLYVPGITNNGSKDELVRAAIYKKIYEDTGLNIEFEFSSSTYDEELNTVNLKIAGGDIDAWMSAQSGGYVERGVTEPLDDLIDQYGQNIKEKIDSELYDYYRVDGKLMGLGLQSSVPLAITPLIRKDLLDKVGLEVPKTMDELEKAVLKIKELDPSYVGISSQIAQWIPLAMFAYGGVSNYFDDKGFPVPMISTDYSDIYYEDDYLYDYLGLLNRWYKNGVLNPEMFTMTADKYMDLYNQGKIICTTWGAENVTQTYADEQKNGKSEQEWVMMDQLRTTNNLPSAWCYGGSAANSIYVYRGSKNAETFIRVLDWFCANKENALLTLLGIEGISYTVDDRGKVSSVQDSTGEFVYWDKFGSMFYSAWSEMISELTKDYVNDEWKKVYTMDAYSRPDAKVNYTYTETEALMTTLKTITNEYFVKIIVSDEPVEKGIKEFKKTLYDAGVEQYEAERLKCFKEVYPDGYIE